MRFDFNMKKEPSLSMVNIDLKFDLEKKQRESLGLKSKVC